MKGIYERISDYYIHKKVRNNIREYEPLGSNEHLCPFCDKPHHEYQVHHNGFLENLWKLDEEYDNEQDYQIEMEWSSFYMCESCQTIYQTVEWKEHTSLFPKAATEAEERFASLDRADSRIQRYLEEGILEGVEAWVKDSFCVTACFFCRQNIDFKKTWNSAKLWVAQEEDSVGGEVLVCWKCDEKIGHHHTIHTESLQKDSCCQCENIYPITISEYTSRKEAKTTGQHLCPTCVFKTYNTWNIQRWAKVTCKSCGIVLNKDRNSQRIADRTFNVTKIAEETDLKCEDCRLAESFVFFHGKGSPVEIWLGISRYGEAGLFMSSVYQCTYKGVLRESKIIQSTDPLPIEEATLQGRELLNTIYNGLFAES